MRRFLLTAVIAVGFIIGFHVSIEPGATPALAVTPSPVPSCQFAGYDPSGSVINTTIVCATPGAGGGVNSVNGGSCISVNPNTGDTIVDYTCATPVPLTVSTPLVLSTPGGNSINIACPSCGSGGGTAIAFSASATGTNYNNQGFTASSYFPSTATITPPTPPYVIVIHALVIAKNSGPSYYGLLVSSDATHFDDFGLADSSSGFAVVDTDSTVSASFAGGSRSGNNAPFPAQGFVTNQPVYIEAKISVFSSTLATVGALINGAPICRGNSLGSGCAFTSELVDLSVPFTVYALGAASTDVIYANYQVNP